MGYGSHVLANQMMKKKNLRIIMWGYSISAILCLPFFVITIIGTLRHEPLWMLLLIPVSFTGFVFVVLGAFLSFSIGIASLTKTWVKTLYFALIALIILSIAIHFTFGTKISCHNRDYYLERDWMDPINFLYDCHYGFTVNFYDEWNPVYRTKDSFIQSLPSISEPEVKEIIFEVGNEQAKLYQADEKVSPDNIVVRIFENTRMLSSDGWFNFYKAQLEQQGFMEVKEYKDFYSTVDYERDIAYKKDGQNYLTQLLVTKTNLISVDEKLYNSDQKKSLGLDGKISLGLCLFRN